MPRHPRGVRSLRSNDLTRSAAQQTIADGAEIMHQAYGMAPRQPTMLRLPYVAPAGFDSTFGWRTLKVAIAHAYAPRP